jgi:hypothetical protein
MVLFLSINSIKAQKLNFIDEGKSDSSFMNFRKELTNAVSGKDTQFIISKLDSNIISGYGDDSGIKNFSEIYLKNDKINLWEIMKRIIPLGGTFNYNHDFFTAPYIFANWPDTLDAAKNTAIIGDSVRVYDEPCTCANVIYRFTYDIVKIDDTYFNRKEWEEVFLPDNTKGFIENKYVYSPLDYRLGFSRINNKWKINFLISGK